MIIFNILKVFELSLDRFKNPKVSVPLVLIMLTLILIAPIEKVILKLVKEKIKKQENIDKESASQDIAESKSDLLTRVKFFTRLAAGIIIIALSIIAIEGVA